MSDFYVGYLPKAPAALGGFVRKAVVGLGALGVMTALVLVIGQTRLASSVFEYGKVRDFEGTMEASPYPTLLVSRPGEAGPHEAYSRYLLVAPGKHGAERSGGRLPPQVRPLARAIDLSRWRDDGGSRAGVD